MARTTLGTIAILLCAASAASAQVKPEQFVGGYTLVNAGGQRVGAVSVNTQEGAVVLRTRLRDGTTRPDLVLDLARSTATRAVFRFPESPAPTVGLAGIVTDADAVAAATSAQWAPRTLELTPDLRAVLKEGATVLARERLQRARRALIVHASTYDATHVNAFRAYATRVASRYRDSMGYALTETMLGTSVDVVCERLLRAADEAAPFDRLVFIGHGGWDGPSLGKYDEPGMHQASSHYNAETFAKLVDAIKRGMTPTGAIFTSSCHGGGNNVYEKAKEHNNPYIWSDDVAAQTGRTAAGPAGYTSTEFTEQHVFAVLEGQGTTKQEVRWASPKGVRSIRPGGTLAGTPLRPVEPVHMPAPPPVVADAVEPSATPAAVTPPAPTVDLPLGVVTAN